MGVMTWHLKFKDLQEKLWRDRYKINNKMLSPLHLCIYEFFIKE